MKRTLQIQTALFFKQDFLGAYEELSLAIKRALGESTSIQLLGLPIDAPSEFPRLTLTYNGIITINIAKSRMDFFYTEFEIGKADIVKIFQIMKDFGLAFGRIGFVKNILLDGDVNFLKRYLSEDKINGVSKLKEISIALKNIINVDGFECNNIQSMTNRKNIQNGISEENIILMRDINTLAEDISENEINVVNLVTLLDSLNSETDKNII